MSDLHPQEVPVVRLSSTGIAIPAWGFGDLKADAMRLGDGHVHALFHQVARQTRALGAVAPPSAVPLEAAPSSDSHS